MIDEHRVAVGARVAPSRRGDSGARRGRGARDRGAGHPAKARRRTTAEGLAPVAGRAIDGEAAIGPVARGLVEAVAGRRRRAPETRNRFAGTGAEPEPLSSVAVRAGLRLAITAGHARGLVEGVAGPHVARRPVARRGRLTRRKAGFEARRTVATARPRRTAPRRAAGDLVEASARGPALTASVDADATPIAIDRRWASVRRRKGMAPATSRRRAERGQDHDEHLSPGRVHDREISIRRVTAIHARLGSPTS